MIARFSQYHCEDCTRMNCKVAFPYGPSTFYCVDCEGKTTHRRR